MGGLKMIQVFKTKANMYGANDYLTIDHVKREYRVHQYNGFFAGGETRLTRRDFKMMIADCKKECYTNKIGEN